MSSCSPIVSSVQVHVEAVNTRSPVRAGRVTRRVTRKLGKPRLGSPAIEKISDQCKVLLTLVQGCRRTGGQPSRCVCVCVYMHYCSFKDSWFSVLNQLLKDNQTNKSLGACTRRRLSHQVKPEHPSYYFWNMCSHTSTCMCTHNTQRHRCWPCPLCC